LGKDAGSGAIAPKRAAPQVPAPLPEGERLSAHRSSGPKSCANDPTGKWAVRLAASWHSSSMERQPVLVARGLKKAFRRTTAVAGVDLDVREGERVALLGANGTGKTTTLLMLLGAITPDEGTIDVLGHRLPHGRGPAMQQVGFSAGYLPLPDRLRVLEVLRVFGDLYNVPDARAAAMAGLERFGIAHLADDMASELSSGQRTLVALVKATMHAPRLLVLDEPTASLDPDVAARARRGLDQLWEEQGTSVLITSHNMSEVERFCERVVFISRGKVVANGSAEAVAAQFGRDTLEDVFLHLATEESL
jgi:ABC-2 type transport system ATP-binding protein